MLVRVPFRRDKEDRFRFFGRDVESDEIVSLITSHRLTLAYAQSGAGKTSIFNAHIIHTLEDHGFEVLPMARVQATVHYYKLVLKVVMIILWKLKIFTFIMLSKACLHKLILKSLLRTYFCLNSWMLTFQIIKMRAEK